MLKVAVCEDDAGLRSVLSRAIKAEGYSVVLARNGHEAIRDWPSAKPNVAVIDIGLPDADGRDVCLALRAGGFTAPVLFLTALDGVHDKILGFEAGADDYLTKPFELAELFARIAVLARRSPTASPDEHGIQLDPRTHAASLDGHSVTLTPTEFRLLAKLMGSPGEVVRRRALVAAAWPSGAIVHDNTLDSYIRRIRKKLAQLVGDSTAIETVRGVGYVWR